MRTKISIPCSLVIAATTTFADFAEVSSGLPGATLQAINGNEIELREESIAVHCSKYGFEVFVDYLFVNTSEKSRSVTMGFPNIRLRGGESFHFITPIRDFWVKEGAKTIPVYTRPGTFPEGLYDSIPAEASHGNYETVFECIDVAFSPGQAMTLRTGFKQDMASGNTFFRYILRTGALWKGPIRKIDIFITGIFYSPPMSIHAYTIVKIPDEKKRKALTSGAFRQSLFATESPSAWYHDLPFSTGIEMNTDDFSVNGTTIELHMDNIEPISDIELRHPTGDTTYFYFSRHRAWSGRDGIFHAEGMLRISSTFAFGPWLDPVIETRHEFNRLYYLVEGIDLVNCSSGRIKTLELSSHGFPESISKPETKNSDRGEKTAR